MNKSEFKNQTNRRPKRLSPILLTLLASGHLLITACATTNRKQESIQIILEKEKTLIEAVKAERSQTDVQQAVEQSPAAKRAETHLLLSLEEILKANEVITNKLLKQNKEEALNERVETRSH